MPVSEADLQQLPARAVLAVGVRAALRVRALWNNFETREIDIAAEVAAGAPITLTKPAINLPTLIRLKPTHAPAVLMDSLRKTAEGIQPGDSAAISAAAHTIAEALDLGASALPSDADRDHYWRAASADVAHLSSAGLGAAGQLGSPVPPAFFASPVWPDAAPFWWQPA